LIRIQRQAAKIPFQKTKYHLSTDILRIPEKYQKYRYAKISQLIEAGQFCRYVGEYQISKVLELQKTCDKYSYMKSNQI
jgi:hypothetical protein